MSREALGVEVVSLSQILINQYFLNEDLEDESLLLKRVLEVVINYLEEERLSQEGLE